MEKQRWIGLILALTFIGVSSLGFAPTAQSEQTVADQNLASIVRAYPTPEKLAAFLRKRIAFQEDEKRFGEADYWQAPEEVLERGAGDCEDYALLAQEVFKQQGVGAFLLSLYGSGGYAHTVCVFLDGRTYSVINNDRVVRYRAKSLEELATFLYPQWSWGAVAEKMGHRGRAVQEIYNRSRTAAVQGSDGLERFL